MFLMNLTNNWEEGYGAKGLYNLWRGVLRNWHNIGRLPFSRELACLIERLKREAREGAISTVKVFSIQAEMLSGPEAECCLVLRSRF